MRYTPFEAMDRLFEQMRREMRGVGGDEIELWGGDWSNGAFGRDLNMDLTERDGEFVFTADLPGFDPEEIDLRYDDGHLLLSAVHESGEESDVTVTSRHRSITERVAVPSEIVEDDITASYHNGVLEVHLPVDEDATETGHSIEIN